MALKQRRQKIVAINQANINKFLGVLCLYYFLFLFFLFLGNILFLFYLPLMIWIRLHLISLTLLNMGEAHYMRERIDA